MAPSLSLSLPLPLFVFLALVHGMYRAEESGWLGTKGETRYKVDTWPVCIHLVNFG